MLQLSLEKILHHQVSLEIGCKKLILVLVTSMPVTKARDEAESIKIVGADKNGKESKAGNLA